jgi:predicted PurR-regulated permease PerM
VMAHPLEIFVVILVGANLGGITGMVLAIPIYTIIRSFAKVFFENFKVVQLMTRNMNESGF